MLNVPLSNGWDRGEGRHIRDGAEDAGRGRTSDFADDLRPSRTNTFCRFMKILARVELCSSARQEKAKLWNSVFPCPLAIFAYWPDVGGRRSIVVAEILVLGSLVRGCARPARRFFVTRCRRCKAYPEAGIEVVRSSSPEVVVLETRRSPDVVSIAVTLVLCLCWGSQQVVIKMTALCGDPLMQLSIRHATAALVLGGFSMLT
ncbi:hypothetical protein [Burkholderia mayonis]|uniref:hypothetical protein n=1 Tax=Burkholderia mayonis TaxID=1385591 RepID=UPI00131F27F9|nr:hypothetical protein [Burkholderia mayonis]